MKIEESIQDEFSDMSYPIRNPMEISPQLSDGSETVFKGENIEYKAVNIVIDLRSYFSDAPNDGFPYEKSDEIIEDILFALEKENII